MEMHKIYILVIGMSFLNIAWGQHSDNIGVCLRGDGRVIPGQDLRKFTVSISGTQSLGEYFELGTANTAQCNQFRVSSPQEISIIEPSNPTFACSKKLAPNTHSINVVIHYPPDYLPFCLITTSRH